MAEIKRYVEVLTDIDGNTYNTVKIGDQLWTAENLKTTRYNDGTKIPLVESPIAWRKLEEPGYCWYNNDISNKNIYGALYNWHVVNTCKLAPEGWHVPVKEDLKILEKFLINNGYNWDGSTTENKIAKAMAADRYWMGEPYMNGSITWDMPKNNKSGFTATPSGNRNSVGGFTDINFLATWWIANSFSADRAYYYYIVYTYEDATMNTYYKNCGFSVRLVRERD